MPDKEKFIAVFTGSLTEAHIVKGRLESEGIPAFLSYESAGPVFGITVNGIGETAVWVPRALADDARKVLEGEDFDFPPEPK